MKKVDRLRKERDLIKKQLNDNLDLLVGSVVRSPAMMYHSLTTKIEGKTVSRYIRKNLVPEVKQMTFRHKRVRELIHRLSNVNWELLKIESKD